MISWLKETLFERVDASWIVAAVAGLVMLLWWDTSCRGLPGVKGPRAFVLGVLPEMASQGYVKVQEYLVHKYGRVSQYFMGRVRVLLITDPDMIRDICVKHFKLFQDRPTMAVANEPFSEKGFIWSRGAYWSSVRAAATPMFHSENMKNFHNTLHAKAQELVGRLKSVEDGASVSMNDLTAQLATDVIGEVAFGVDFGSLRGSTVTSKLLENLKAVLKSTNDMLRLSIIVSLLVPSLFWPVKVALGWIPGTKDFGIRKHFDELFQLLAESLETRDKDRLKALKGKDFLSLMEKARRKDTGALLTPTELGVLIFEMFAAGSETTANTLATCLYFLAQNPEAEARVIGEVDRFYARVPGGEADKRPTYEELSSPSFQYVDQVIKETLRMFPPGASLVREASEAVQVGDVVIPRGQMVMMSVFWLQRDPQYFPEPEVWRPERFDPESEEHKSRHPYAYVPFGLGPRMCLGTKLAEAELRLGLVTLYRHFHFTLDEAYHPPGEPLSIDAGLVVKATNGIHVRVHRRSMPPSSA